jgi:hypothetical protein
VTLQDTKYTKDIPKWPCRTPKSARVWSTGKIFSS